MLNLWDKSYYGYNRKEQEDVDRKWREEVFATINQEALPGKWWHSSNNNLYYQAMPFKKEI